MLTYLALSGAAMLLAGLVVWVAAYADADPRRAPGEARADADPSFADHRSAAHAGDFRVYGAQVGGSGAGLLYYGSAY
ncbi:MAG: hypothetical protein ACRDT4_13165 [Micromonosporaceae bacterium]